VVRRAKGTGSVRDE